MGELKRTLSLIEIVFFATGVILGAGIYSIIGKAAGFGGNMLWLSFAIAAFTAILTLFSYAELSSIYPSSGGEFTYVKESAGLKWAYFIGIIVSLSGIISSATISVGFAGYFSELVNFPGWMSSIGIISVIFLVNLSGVRQSSVVNIIFTVIETLGLIFVIYSAVPSVGQVDYLQLPPKGIEGLLAGAAICFFAFTGFEDVVKLAEESKNPKKNIPKALFISTIIVMILYLSVAFVVVNMIPFGELANSGSPLSKVIEKRFGNTGAIIISVVALFSTSNSLLSNMLGSSRVIYNFGKESKKLSLLARVLPNQKTPALALILVSIFTIGFSLIGDVKILALITNFFVFITFLTVNITIIYLRTTKKDLVRPFKIPGNIKGVPVIPIVAIFMVLLLMGFTLYGLFYT